MSGTHPDLDAVARHWTPGPVTTTGTTTAWSVAAFSALLDLDPVAGSGDPLPPLWHWFGFLDHPGQDELGDDGHPAHGHFMPPIPDRRRMFAGGRLSIHEPMRVEEVLERRTALVRCEAKSGRSGEMLLVTLRHEFVREDRVVAVEEQDLVYRSQPPGRARGVEVPQPPEPGVPPSGALVLTPDERLLFRFSALTYNTHRIHYDLPYATAVEGYPGLVVHGPLLALLLLESPRRHHPTAPVIHFEFRLHRPAFAGHPIAVRAGHGVESPDRSSRLDLEAGAAGTGASVNGTVALLA